MPKDKDLKRLVRARMEKTGEAYTAARRHVLRRFDPVPPDLAALAGMSDAAVQRATGRSWAEWTRILDAEDAVTLPHAEIARHVSEEHDVADWWAQTVTVGYERIRGLREVGQRRSGTYDANKSRTFPVSVDRLYAAFADDAERGSWMDGAAPTIRTTRRNEIVRMVWDDGTVADVRFTAKAPDRSTVAVQHRNLPDRQAMDTRKAWWDARLDALDGILTHV